MRDRDRFEHLNLIRISSFEFRVSHPRAFTLVEVLAAIGILAVVLPVIMYSLDLAGNAALLARHRTQATMLAQAKLDEFIVLQDFSVASGDFGEQYPEYTWTIELTDWDTPDGLSADTLQLDVIVSWTQRNRIHEAKLSTLLYQSSASSSSSGGLVP
ncbi:MAG: type II secretion system GspH family protein [Phycisphaerales bacterium]|nr:type II secretion system GspH family protein [Phycisphaerales bacterium]